MSDKNFLKGAAVLGAAGLIVKIIGAVYRIPLTNLIGTEGIGYYQPAYQVYNLLLVISLAGFPTAIARLVSEKIALGNYLGARQVFKTAMSTLITLAAGSSLLVFIFADQIAVSIGYPGTSYSLSALTPALFFVPIMSVYRGYFQGMQNMVPTALSQIIEQFFRFAVGLYLAYIFVQDSLPKAAGGASFGASAGGMAGFILMFFVYILNKKKIDEKVAFSKKNVEENWKRVFKRLLQIAIPITIGASIVPLMGLIDAKLVSMRLLAIGYSEIEATDLYGQLSGTAQTFINFPQVFSIAIAISFFVLAEPIIVLFYPALGSAKHASVGYLLAILAVSVIFLTVVQSLTAILQAVEKQKIPVKKIAIGALVKVILNYILVGIKSLNVAGAAYSTIAA